MRVYFDAGVLQDMWVHWLYIGAIAILNICLFSWLILSMFGEKIHYGSMLIIGLFMLIAGMSTGLYCKNTDFREIFNNRITSCRTAAMKINIVFSVHNIPILVFFFKL